MHLYPMLSAEIINDFRGGDETAFREIYLYFSPKIYRFAFGYLKEKEHTEEIVQEAFLCLWENRQKFELDKPLEPYLFTIAKRLVLDQLRKQISTVHLRKKLLAAISEQHNDTEEQIIFSDMLVYAEKAISQLPQQQQTVFRLSRVEGLSYDEIAERLKLSRNTVKNHLGVAVKKLKASFSDSEINFLMLIWLSLLT